MYTLAYVTYQDIRSIQTFQEQIVIAIKAPEETKLEIPIPKQDCISVHVKSTKGPIDVYLCEVEPEKPGAKTSEDTGGSNKINKALKVLTSNSTTILDRCHEIKCPACYSTNKHCPVMFRALSRLGVDFLGMSTNTTMFSVTPLLDLANSHKTGCLVPLSLPNPQFQFLSFDTDER
ncbi:hypothetical protein AAES_130093 [Amazona aestiva]|uniref:E2F transcription factor CC-MB domain-containing protein n=1 Tax=Amazona aestiva TaxID=12930 RepID=A0A0Q3PLK2_AMAAE|nr:hypothetical protein AAES_130093 [Amazona aestiva]